LNRLIKGQTALRIKLCTNVSLSSVTSARIKYIKSNGITGYWAAELESATDSIYYDILSSNDLDVAGIWKMWSYLIFTNGNIATGKTVEFLVVDEGET